MSISANGSGRRPCAASAAASRPSLFVSSCSSSARGRGRRIDLQTAAGMRVAADTALRLRPAQHRQRPRRPALAARRPGIDLLLQVEQDDVAERLRTEAADLDVVFHQRQRLAALVGRRREKLPLMIEARAPRQHAADIEPLAFDLPEHVRRIDAFGRRRVVRAACRVDVMVAAVEAARRRIDPALEPHGDFRARRTSDRRPAGPGAGIVTVRLIHRYSGPRP